jgi:hypothetical protein
LHSLIAISNDSLLFSQLQATMKVSSLKRTATKKNTSTERSNSQQHHQEVLLEEVAGERKRLEQVNLIDFIRGDSRLPERYVFDPDLFPDYSRSTQRRLVTMIQDVCERQQSPVVVHQWANEEHDDRVVRRIRFRCAFFRKKKRTAQPGVASCQFQFQVCYQAKYGWCLLNGKGQSRHVGHPLMNHQSKSTTTTPNTAASHPKPAPKQARAAKPKARSTTAKHNFSASAVAAKSAAAAKPVLKKEPGVACCVECLSPPPSPLLYNDENINTVQAAWKDLKQCSTSDCKMAPAYTDFALDPMEDIMDWDLLDEPEVVLPTSVPASAGGFLHKTVYLTETPFPEVTDLEDKCGGLMEALRAYAKAHDFVVTVEDYAAADRPGEKTMRVVLHCLGAGCCYQVALLWVVGLMKWQIYCQSDGIFVHGCGRLEGHPACSAMAATPLNQALDHLVDFLNGEVVCPDGEADKATVAAWKNTEEEKPVSENVRKETRKAVAKAAGLDATASAA